MGSPLGGAVSVPSSHCLGFTTRPRLLVRPDGSSKGDALGPAPSLTLMLDMMCILDFPEPGSRPLPAGPLVACMGKLACSKAARAGGGPLEHNWVLLWPCPGRLMTTKDQNGLSKGSGGSQCVLTEACRASDFGPTASVRKPLSPAYRLQSSWWCRVHAIRRVKLSLPGGCQGKVWSNVTWPQS